MELKESAPDIPEIITAESSWFEILEEYSCQTGNFFTTESVKLVSLS